MADQFLSVSAIAFTIPTLLLLQVDANPLEEQLRVAEFLGAGLGLKTLTWEDVTHAGELDS